MSRTESRIVEPAKAFFRQAPFVCLLVAFALLPAAGVLEGGVGVWTTHGPAAGAISALAAAPSDPAILYAGSQTGAGLFRSTDAGESWTAIGAGTRTAQGPGVATTAIAIDPNDSSTVYIGSGGFEVDLPFGTLFKSTDGGASWLESDSGLSGGMARSLLLDPLSPAMLYASTVQGLATQTRSFRSTDGGATWTALSGAPLILAIDPVTTETLYGADNFSSPEVASKSTDAGATWTPLNTGPFAIDFTTIAVDPQNHDTVYAGFFDAVGFGLATGGILKSTDGGASWSSSAGVSNPASADLPNCEVDSIAVDPVHEGTLYASLGRCGLGVYQSTDGGSSWAAFGVGFPSQTGPSLVVIDRTGSGLHAAAPDGNVYDFQASAAAACVPDANTLCLNGGRFQVQAQWTDFQGESGLASVASGAVSNSSGVLWFFSPDNWELLVKVLNGCGVNGNYWFFGAASTNVQYTIQAIDTQTGDVKTYTNPLGSPSPAITDTAAFPGCP